MTAADLSHENLALLEAKLRADLETVMKVRALFKEHLGSGASPSGILRPNAQVETSDPATVTASPDPFQMPRRAPTPDVKVLVREAVAAAEDRFKIGFVKEQLKQRQADFPDTSIRSVLMRMVQMGELKVASYATGRGGNVFEKPVKQVPEAVVEAEPAAS